MQTKLMAVSLMLAASLLWTPRTFAATQKAKAQTNSVLEKPKFFGTASKKHSNTHNVPIIWCDLHPCKERYRLVGRASFYGKGYWQGRKMANGERFDYRKMTVALWYLPLGTQVRITNLENHQSVIVTVTDRGPAHALHRIADLSQAAAEALGYKDEGLTTVLIQPVTTVETESLPVESLQPEIPSTPVLEASNIEP